MQKTVVTGKISNLQRVKSFDSTLVIFIVLTGGSDVAMNSQVFTSHQPLTAYFIENKRKYSSVNSFTKKILFWCGSKH